MVVLPSCAWWENSADQGPGAASADLPIPVTVGHEIVLHGEERRRGPGRDADLGVDVLGVVLGRAAGNEQPLGDLGVAAPGGDQREDLRFAVAQPRGPRRGDAARW